MSALPTFNFLTLPSLPKKLPAGHAREWIAGGDAGTTKTIHRMQDMVTYSKRDERVRAKYVIPILDGKKYPFKDAPEKNYWDYCQNLFLYCRDEIRYVHDPVGVEMIEDAWTTLQRGAADCDSIVICFAAMCESIGRACRFVTIRPVDGGAYFHVYCEVNIPGKGWVGADCTMKDKPFGWRPDQKFPSTSWPASKDMPEVDQADPVMPSTGTAGLGDMNLLCQKDNGLSFLADFHDDLPTYEDADYVACIEAVKRRHGGSSASNSETDACITALDQKQRAWHAAHPEVAYTDSELYHPYGEKYIGDDPRHIMAANTPKTDWTTYALMAAVAIGGVMLWRAAR